MPSACSARASITVALAPQLWPYRMIRAARFSSSVGPFGCPSASSRMTIARASFTRRFSNVSTMHGAGIFPLKIPRQNHRAVHRVIVPKESADKADHDRSRCRDAPDQQETSRLQKSLPALPRKRVVAASRSQDSSPARRRKRVCTGNNSARHRRRKNEVPGVSFCSHNVSNDKKATLDRMKSQVLEVT